MHSCTVLILSVLLLIKSYLHFVSHYQNKLGDSQCTNQMTSICLDNKVTKWNRENVGYELKQWIKSVSFELNPSNYKIGEENNCKQLFCTKNDFFHRYGPDAISDQVMIFGNLNHHQKTYFGENIEFKGPVWADLNNPDDWKIMEFSRGVFQIKLHQNASLRNGLYYGKLNNEELRIGKNDRGTINSQPIIISF